MNNPTKDPNDITKETVNELMLNQCNDIGNVSGIYKIVNKVNGKYYVGSTKNFYNRWKEHKRTLAAGIHPNEKLQNAYNKYGNSNFDYIVVENVDEPKLLIIEQIYLNICKYDPTTNYNLTYSSTAPMRFPSKSTLDRLKMSLNKYWSKSENRKLRSEQAKVYLNQDSVRKKMSRSAKAAMTDERRKWLSESTKRQLKEHHPTKDLTVYNFSNSDGRTFSGTRSELIRKFDLPESNVSKLLSGKRNKVNGWRLMR